MLRGSDMPGPYTFAPPSRRRERAVDASSGSLIGDVTRCSPCLAALAAALALASCRASPGSSETAGADETSTGGDATGTSTETGTGSGSDGWTDGPDPTETTGTDTGGGPQTAPDVIDYETCELDWGESANVIGETPQGTFEGRYAWFGWITCNGEGLSPTLVIAESPDDLAAAVALEPMGEAVPKPSMEWFLFGACSPDGGWVGEGKVQVYLRHDGPWDLGEGLIQISDTYRIFDEVDPEDPPRMSGHIAITKQDGWNIEGDFQAAYCGPLSYAISCD